MDWPDGLRIIEVESTGSTNADALALAATTNDDLTLILAHRQTAGRGRLNRQWVSKDGNLHATLLVRLPHNHHPVTGLVFASALATWRTVRALVPQAADVRIKWPNDTLIDGRKVSGILIEAADGFAAIGIGINIACHPATGALYPATSLAAYTTPPARDSVAKALARDLLGCLEEWGVNGLDSLRGAYLAAAWRFGEEVCVATTRQTVGGRFIDIDTFGLVLEQPDGTRLRVSAGDLIRHEPDR